jgi:DNA-binding winged helix-turn-helix (wHTH) protein/tetratricopeptide (TPR) repeat protein
MDAACIYRFGDFELDVAAYELRRGERRVRLSRQPMDLLILLVERRRELVTHQQIAERLWRGEVFVDVQTSIHSAILKIRRALRDSSDTPAFVEAVPGRGYRFVAPVDLSGTAERSRPLRLAVRPFEWLGSEDGQYIADGLTDDVVASLGRLAPGRMMVVSRSSTLAYGPSSKTLHDIARDLKVDYVVEGTLRGEGGRYRGAFHLVRTMDLVEILADSYDRAASNLLDLQAELSAAVARAIHLRLAPEDVRAAGLRHSTSADAFELYLRGRTLADQRTPAATARAVEYYERAVGIDPHYALVWAALAEVWAASPLNGDAPPVLISSRAEEAATRAVRADARLAEGHFARGMVDWLFGWDWPGAEAALRQALALNPSHASAWWMLGHVVSQTGRHEEGLQCTARARELDPFGPMAHAMSSQVAFQARDHRSALDHARRALAIDSGFWIGHMQAAQALEQLGDVSAALDASDHAVRMSGANSKALSTKAHALVKIHRTKEARDVLLAFDAASRVRYVPPYAVALVHAALGNRDEVFTCLERAKNVRDVHLIFLSTDPKWDPYRVDPRFVDLLATLEASSAGSLGTDQTTQIK